MLAKLGASSGVGPTAVAASYWRPDFLAYIETILEDVSKLLDDDHEDQPDKILKVENHGILEKP